MFNLGDILNRKMEQEQRHVLPVYSSRYFIYNTTELHVFWLSSHVSTPSLTIRKNIGKIKHRRYLLPFSFLPTLSLSLSLLHNPLSSLFLLPPSFPPLFHEER